MLKQVFIPFALVAMGVDFRQKSKKQSDLELVVNVILSLTLIRHQLYLRSIIVCNGCSIKHMVSTVSTNPHALL